MLALGKRVGSRAIRGVGHGQALPGHGGVARQSALRRAREEWDDAHGEIEATSVLEEERTELSGLDHLRGCANRRVTYVARSS